MGMPFPIGMRHADEIAPSLSPWLWGINGAASVWASVLAVIIALSLGIGASYWAGFGCYLIAGAVYLLAIRATTESEVAAAHHGDKNP
jgi:hypothetical protein